MSDRPPAEPCSCPGPGFCPRFSILQQQYPFEVCQGRHGAEKAEAYRRKWSRGRTPLPVAAAPPKAAAPPAKPAYVPCRFEGEVVRRCQTCGPKEPRHRRACSHPLATLQPNDTGGAVAPGVCTREFVAPDVTACSRCEFYDPPERRGQ